MGGLRPMAWCPNCKNEYRAGVTICPDCQTALVEELVPEAEFLPVFDTDEEDLKEKILAYMAHCGYAVRCEAYQEETGKMGYRLLIEKDALPEAAKEIAALLAVEAGQDGPTAGLKARRTEQASSSVYVNAKDRYEEYRSSGFLFLFLGVAMLVFALLNITGLLSVLASAFSLILLVLFGVALICLGISSLHRSKAVAGEEKTEAAEAAQVMEFLRTTFPSGVLSDMTEENLAPELLYLKQFEVMKEQTGARFPDLEEAFLDSLLEDYMNSLEQEN